MTEEFFNCTQNCPICDSLHLEPFATFRYWREVEVQFSCCQDCGLRFANPMPQDGLIEKGNNALVKFSLKNRSWEDEFRDARQAYLRGKLLAGSLSRWKTEGTLLDLGCNNGFLMLGFREHSKWNVEGVEIAHDLCTFIQSKLAITCHQGTLENLNLPEGSYDFILCHDLIEHINQPHRFLRELRRVLKPGGRIEIITPNALQDLAYSKRAFDSGWPMTILLNHFMMFSPQALQTALERSGLITKKLYCYDIRYALKDFGVFGLGKPHEPAPAPCMEEALGLPVPSFTSLWTSELIDQVRTHRKTGYAYGLIREIIPDLLTIRIPPSLGVGHEIYALGERALEKS